MAGASRIHWVAPAVMTGALFIGFLFALGHHLFYASLAGHKAPTGHSGWNGLCIPGQIVSCGHHLNRFCSSILESGAYIEKGHDIEKFGLCVFTVEQLCRSP